MSEHDVVQAWKDRRYRSRLAGADAAALPEHPAGVVEIPDGRLEDVAAAASFWCWLSIGCTQSGVGCGGGGGGGGGW